MNNMRARQEDDEEGNGLTVTSPSQVRSQGLSPDGADLGQAQASAMLLSQPNMANVKGEDASETATHTLQARGTAKELELLSYQLGEDALHAEIGNLKDRQQLFEMALAKTQSRIDENQMPTTALQE